MSKARATKPARKRAARQPQPKPKAKPKPTAKAKAAAAKATAAAKKAGAVGPNGSDAHRLLRDSAIVARLHAGEKPEALASEFAISKRSVQAIAKKFPEERPLLMDEQPQAILDTISRDFERRIRDFDAMAIAHAERNPNVAVAAMKGGLQATERLIDLMGAVGKLPENLELFRAESVLRQMADEMIETMEQVEKGECTPIEAAARFRRMVGAEEQQQLPVAA